MCHNVDYSFYVMLGKINNLEGTFHKTYITQEIDTHKNDEKLFINQKFATLDEIVSALISQNNPFFLNVDN